MEDVIAVFGDVHGELDLLKKLITKIREVHPKAELYTLGDLVDRGLNSKDVIQLCIDEGVKGIYGNHDQWLRELVMNKVFDPFCLKPIMGGKSTLESYGVDFHSDGYNYFHKGRPNADLAKELLNAIPLSHKKWLSDLKPYLKLHLKDKTYWLVHAGLTQPVASSYKASNDDGMMSKVANDSVNSILWPSPNLGGGLFQDNLFWFKDAIQIFGHRPVKEPIIKEHFIAMDTGCGTCEPFTLSAIILPTNEIIQVLDEVDVTWT